MIRSKCLWDEKNGMIRFSPGWPPRPSVHDRWVKPARNSRQKNLMRRVLSIRGWIVTYEDQDGNVKTAHADQFQRWTDDSRAVPERLREYVVLKPDPDEAGVLYKLRKKKRVSPHPKGAYRWSKSR